VTPAVAPARRFSSGFRAAGTGTSVALPPVMHRATLLGSSLLMCSSLLGAAACGSMADEVDETAACEEELSPDPACGDQSDVIAECARCWEECGHFCRHTVPLCNQTFTCDPE
jgi:hypothetical protein